MAVNRNQGINSAFENYESRFKKYGNSPYYNSTLNSKYKLQDLENELSSIEQNKSEMNHYLTENTDKIPEKSAQRRKERSGKIFIKRRKGRIASSEMSNI